ncbi:hypothetical protein SAMN05421510_102929 [Nitrosomonas ureae]|uniref:Uncharacterized protein n=1 Tax=Nitrosomonas ureae TaxID=44577 RepID=A0A1H9EC58_9PROT|nr:hypothetical protein SAMN05421510_102929 [Nitrosomonas ureae]
MDLLNIDIAGTSRTFHIKKYYLEIKKWLQTM